MDLRGKVQTVRGPVEPARLGVTLTHEHLALNAGKFFIEPGPPFPPSHAHLPYTLENFGWIQRHPFSHRENMKFYPDEAETILEELKYYKSNGGGTMVENSSLGLDRDVAFLKRAAIESGVNIVAGTGYFLDDVQDDSTRQLTVEKMAEAMLNDLTCGADNTNIRCGVIGEVGCSWPLTLFEKRSVQATGMVQAEMGCPVIVHPGRHPKAPFEIIRLYQEAGGNVSKMVMSHLDRTYQEEDDYLLLELAATGCLCEYDLWGTEVAHYQFSADLDMPNDAQRLRKVKLLLQEGYVDRVVIAQDICAKHNLMKYGGHGYSHILLNVVPKMLQRGITQQQVDKILVDNPKHWLAFDK